MLLRYEVGFIGSIIFFFDIDLFEAVMFYVCHCGINRLYCKNYFSLLIVIVVDIFMFILEEIISRTELRIDCIT